MKVMASSLCMYIIPVHISTTLTQTQILMELRSDETIKQIGTLYEAIEIFILNFD